MVLISEQHLIFTDYAWCFMSNEEDEYYAQASNIMNTSLTY
jgi:hypothetical protein